MTTIEQARRHRTGLRAAGLRPIRIWVPDIHRPGFAEECRRQSLLASGKDEKNVDLNDFLEAAVGEIDGWT